MKSESSIAPLDMQLNHWIFCFSALQAQKIMKEAESRNNPVPPAASSAPSTSGSTAKQDTATPSTPSVDFDSLKSISDLGIDVSFLDHFKQADKMQNKLNKNADKITELNKMQWDRLSMHPASIDKVKAIPD